MFNSAKYFILGLILTTGPRIFSQITDTIDFKKLHLKVELNTKNKQVEGEVNLIFDYKLPQDSIFLNGINMSFAEVLLNDENVEYRSTKKGLWVPLKNATLQQVNTIIVHYACNPRKGIYFIGWDSKSETAKKQIWTQGQGIDHRHWIPHRDDQTDKLITEIELSFDSKYQVLSNGILIDKQSSRKKTLWHYKMDHKHSSYLIMLAIGKYEVEKTKSKSGVVLKQYYYPERKDDYQRFYYGNEKIFDFLEEEIGVPYPWETYSQVPVQDFRHGGMENTTATIFGDFFLVDSLAFNDRNYSYVNAHELAHQWFGNMITSKNSKHHWLHEGFATYYQWRSEENLYGQDYFDWFRYKEAQLVFSANLSDDFPLGHAKAGSYRFYQKGAWVLYMLHHNLGDDDYKKVIKHYLKTNAYGIVNTDSLNSSIKEIVGVDASPFFDRWVFNNGEPEVKVKGWTAHDSLFFHITPSGDGNENFAEFSLPVQVFFTDGSTVESFVKIGDSPHTSSMLFKKEKKISHWIVNPDMKILASVTEEKAFEYSLNQFKKCSRLLDKYFALQAMREIEASAKKELLTSILQDSQEYYSLRAEALAQLLAMATKKESYAYIQTALSSADIQLQKACLKTFPEADTRLKDLARGMVHGASYELRKNALQLSVDMSRVSKNKWIEKEDFSIQPGIPGRNVEVDALLFKVVLFKDREALAQLKSRTSSDYDFMTRMNAIHNLRMMKYLDEDLLDNYFSALFDYNWKLVKSSREALLEHFKNEPDKKMILKYIDSQQSKWSDFQKRVANRTFALNKD